MDSFIDQCVAHGAPLWVAPILHSALRLKSDRSRRKKVYKLLQRILFHYRLGLKDGDTVQPTYVYSAEVKLLIRNAFPEDIRDYPNPCHGQVVLVTMDDLLRVQHT